MANGNGNGNTWYARLAAALLLAVLGWVVMSTRNSSTAIQANTTANAVQDSKIEQIHDDISEIKGDVKELLRRK